MILSDHIFQLLSDFIKDSNNDDNDLEILEIGCGSGKNAASFLDTKIIKKIDCINDENFSKDTKWHFNEENKRENALYYENKKFQDVTKKYDRIYLISSFQFLFDDKDDNDNELLNLSKIETVESKFLDILQPNGKVFIYTPSFSWFKINRPQVARKVLYSMGTLIYFDNFEVEQYSIGKDEVITILTKKE